MDTFGKCLTAYVLIGLLTFGYSTNAEWQDIRPSIFTGEPIKVSTESNVMGGMMCAIFWPFYVSYKSFKWARP